MQQPTLRNTRVRSVDDVHKICYAAFLGKLPLITRRLDNDERAKLGAGDVYVWEERNPLTDVSGLGIVRWTEGKKWTPSRVVGDFLYYYEKVPDSVPPGDVLARQTYSTTIHAPEPRGPFKICLCTYHSKNTLDQLKTIDEIPELRDLVVPEGTFVRQRKSSRKAGEVSFDAPDGASPTLRKKPSESKRRHSVSHTYAPYPARSSPYHFYALERTDDAAPIASTSSALHISGASTSYLAHGPIAVATNVAGPFTTALAPVTADPDNSPSSGHYAAAGSMASSLPVFGRPVFHHHENAFPSPGPYTAQSNYVPTAGSAYASQAMSGLFPTSPTSHPRRACSLPFDHKPRSIWPVMSPESSPVLWTAPRQDHPSRSHSSNESRSSSRMSGQSEHGLSLAPLSALRESAAYRRDPADDHLLRLISSETGGV